MRFYGDYATHFNALRNLMLDASHRTSFVTASVTSLGAIREAMVRLGAGKTSRRGTRKKQTPREK